ncbi:hypothetical protein Tco_1019199 [Tanacetum coccineum]|uniref:Uncharacterized protein n=1 Tax=Tanacetum coccineum TaxID=301880 RepID=A0ABQ5FWQ9_9ASTR
MDDPNITMEEYIRLEEERARRRGEVYNWETATYAIVFDDAFTSEVTPSYEPTVSPLNDNKIDFRISFDESDDEDYTVIFDKNSFSYKIIPVNDLKTDSENDNDKVNMPSFPSPEPTASYFDDLDFFKDFEKEFTAIVYNDALTSISDFLTETIVSPQHIDEFNLKDETSLSECEKEEQNVLYFNDLFPFNVIYPDDSKSDKYNDDDKIDIKHSSGDLSIEPLPNVIKIDAQWSNKLFETSHDTSSINMAYPGIWIRRIDFLYSFRLKIEDPNITMEEYIRLEEEKARRRAIVFNDTLTSEATLSCEPTVSSLNDNEIDFRISFDESDDEDYTDLVKEISTNIGGEFKNLEILKCWSLETSRRLFNTESCSINATWRIYRANLRGVSHSNSF